MPHLMQSRTARRAGFAGPLRTIREAGGDIEAIEIVKKSHEGNGQRSMWPPVTAPLVVPYSEASGLDPRGCDSQVEPGGPAVRMPCPQYSPGQGRGNLVVVATLEFFWTAVQ